MFEKLGLLIVNRKKFIFSLFIALILAAGAIGSSVFGKLDSGGYSDPKSDSAKVFEYLTDVFKVKDPAVVLVVETKDGVISPESSAAAASEILSGLAGSLQHRLVSVPHVGCHAWVRYVYSRDNNDTKGGFVT